MSSNEPQPATSPSVVSSGLRNSGSNDSAESNIENRISNDEGWNRFAKSSLNQIEYIHSMFDVGPSMFGLHQFLPRSDWTLSASGRTHLKHSARI
jgi:hypothetical protein